MLSVTIAESLPSHTLVVVRGSLDFGGADKLLTKLDRLIDGGSHRILLDLAAVTFCDSTGLSAMVRSRARVIGVNGWIRLREPSPAVSGVLEMTGLRRLFER